MTQLVLQPCGNKDAREHYADTIKRPVDLTRLAQYLSAIELKDLEEIYPNGQVQVWGVTPGKNEGNKRKWERVQIGDVTLFSANNKIFASAVATYKIHSKPLAEYLWKTDDEGNTWEYIYFVSEQQDLNISYAELNSLLDYKSNYVIQGFNVLEEDKSLFAIESLDLYSEQFTAPPSPTAVNKEIEDADSLDKPNNGTGRLEQAAIRAALFKGKRIAKCCICNESFPPKFLVAAHIKKRSLCSLDEKKDINHIAAPMCKFGCDELYEKGYIGVVNGTVTRSKRNLAKSAIIEDYLSKVEGNKCLAWRTETEGYFKFHSERNSLLEPG